MKRSQSMNKQAKRHIAEQKIAQGRIREKWGDDFVDKTIEACCRICYQGSYCNLIPVTEDGAGCCYFLQVEKGGV